MYGEAAVSENFFTDIIDVKKYHALFSIPSYEVATTDHLIGFYSSLLVKDNGCLQIGIGKLGNALANSLIMRHKNNSDYLFLTLGDSADIFLKTIKKYAIFSKVRVEVPTEAEVLIGRVIEDLLSSVLNKTKLHNTSYHN